MRVMISAAASPAAASILRHVRQLGHQVIGIDASVEAEPLGRAFSDEFHVSPNADSAQYLPFLLERLERVDVFLPFIDEELLAIANAWARVPETLRNKIAVSAPDVLRDCLDKIRFQSACAGAGLPIAPLADGEPAFFKPRYGRGGKGVIAASDRRMFDALQGREGVLQKAIRGEEFTVDAIFDREGRVLATAPRRRIRASGVSTIGEVVPDERLHQLAQRLGSRWLFRYAINFQVIRDPDGHDWLIELNPRLAGSAIFSAMAGCDPFAATFAIFRGETWSGVARPLRVWRHWQEMVDERAS